MGRDRCRTIPLALALAAALVLVPAPALADPAPDASDPNVESPADEDQEFSTSFVQIQPGDRVEEPDSSAFSYCTLNFVVTDGEDYYVGTAGHCFEEGDEVEVDGEVVGEVEARQFQGVGAFDWAFIHVYEEYEDDVAPTVRHWGGPTRVPVSAAADTSRMVQPQTGEPLFYYGQGGDGAREGVTALWTPPMFNFLGDVEVGDSGAPVMTGAGQAVGIVVATFPSTEIATNFQQALQSFEAELGEDLELVEGDPFLGVSEPCPSCVEDAGDLQTPAPVYHTQGELLPGSR